MRIAFDAKRIFKNKTGLGNYGRMIVKGILHCCPNDELFLCTPSTFGEHENDFLKQKNVHIIEPQGIRGRFPRLWRTLNNGIDDELNISIFHGLSQELPLQLPGNVRKVVTIHDLIPWRYPHFFSVFDRTIYKQKVRHACKVADKVVAISQQTASDLIEILNVPQEKIKVVYQSCDDIFRKPVSEAERNSAIAKYGLPERYIACVGTVERRKNQVSVVRAMRWLPDDVHIMFFGKRTSYAKEVLEEAEKMNVGARVRIFDNADFHDFPAIYSAAELSVYMSVFEGFGIPVLESLATGTPVVTSSVSSMPEAGGDAALYAEATSPEDIAMQCNKILGDSDFKEKFLQKSVAHCLKFSPENIITELRGLYTELC